MLGDQAIEALFIYGDSEGKEVNTSQYRILIPAKHLERAGHKILIGSMPGVHKEYGDSIIEVDALNWGMDFPEVVLFERNILPDRVEKLRLNGVKRIIVTFDDRYDEMPSYNVSKPWWERNYKNWLKAIGMVDLVIVPSMALVEHYRKYCKEIAYVPNFLDDDIWSIEPSTLDTKVIGWGGTDAHAESWKQKLLIKDLENFLERHPDWTLRLYGNAPRHALPESLLKDNRPWMKFSEWPKEVTGFSIGLAPLNGVYDRYRSNLKALEYGMAGVPFVASYGSPYISTLIRGGFTAYQKDWGALIDTLAEDRNMREKYACEGRSWAQTMVMSKNTKVYEKILWGENV